jgi:hypothetical protein
MCQRHHPVFIDPPPTLIFPTPNHPRDVFLDLSSALTSPTTTTIAPHLWSPPTFTDAPPTRDIDGKEVEHALEAPVAG